MLCGESLLRFCWLGDKLRIVLTLNLQSIFGNDSKRVEGSVNPASNSNQCVCTCASPAFIHVLTLRHCSGRCWAVYSSTEEIAVEEDVKESRPLWLCSCIVSICKLCAAYVLSSTCFCIVFVFLYKYIAYRIISGCWRGGEGSGWYRVQQIIFISD